MGCKPETIMLYWSGELPPEKKKAFEEHLRTCRECALALSDLQSVAADLHTLPVLKPGKDLFREAMNLVDTSDRKRLLFRIPAYAFAVLMIAFLSVSILRQPTINRISEPDGTEIVLENTIDSRIGLLNEKISRLKKDSRMSSGKAVQSRNPVGMDEKIATIRTNLGNLRNCVSDSCDSFTFSDLLRSKRRRT